MSDITVAEMLKIHGKWIQAKPFVTLVSNKLRITERMAYINIKKATIKKEIIKITLPNRNVLYGLEEFGHPYQFEQSLEVHPKNNNQGKIGLFEYLSDADKRKRLKLARGKLEKFQTLLLHAELIEKRGAKAEGTIELIKNAINREKEYIKLLTAE